MKKRLFTTSLLVSIAVVLLAACAPQSAEPPPAAEQPPAATQPPTATALPPTAAPAAQEPAPVEEQPAAPAAEIDIEALIIEKVDGKHDVARIFNAVKTREEWEKTIDRMIGYGAQISEEEKQIMIDYLLSRQP